MRKLSEIKGDDALDVVAAVIGPLAAIAADKEFSALFDGDGDQFAERVRGHLPELVASHKDDVVEVLSALDGTTPDEYRDGMTLPSLLADAWVVLTDEELLAFLSSYGKTRA